MADQCVTHKSSRYLKNNNFDSVITLTAVHLPYHVSPKCTINNPTAAYNYGACYWALRESADSAMAPAGQARTDLWTSPHLAVVTSGTRSDPREGRSDGHRKGESTHGQPVEQQVGCIRGKKKSNSGAVLRSRCDRFARLMSNVTKRNSSV